MTNQQDIYWHQQTPEKIRTFTWFDLLLIIIVICGAVSSIPLIQASQPSTIAIYKDNDIYAKSSLDEDRGILVKGHEGPMKIKIQDGCVSVKSSTCRKQICVMSGTACKPYQQLVCAPNHVLIEIRSHRKTEPKVDAITQ